MLNLGASHNLGAGKIRGPRHELDGPVPPAAWDRQRASVQGAAEAARTACRWSSGSTAAEGTDGRVMAVKSSRRSPPHALKSAPRRLSRRLTRPAARPLNTDIMTLFVMTDDCSYTRSCMAAAAAASLNKVLPRLRLIPRRFHLIRPLAFLPLPRRMLFCLVLGKLLVSTVLN